MRTESPVVGERGRTVATPPSECMSGPSPPELTEQMVRYALEEYVRLGVSADDIVELFHDPENRVLHAFYRRRGQSGIDGLVESYREMVAV